MAVSVTYYTRTPINILASLVPPTQAQASGIDTIKAVCVFGVVADVQALITHNMGLDISAPGYFDPQVIVEPLSLTTYWPLLTFDRTNTNVLRVNKPATDAATTVLVTIRRPGGPFR
jgi:hypothetical protein